MKRTCDSVPARLGYWIATGFGAGQLRRAPGTAGTAIAIPIYLAMRELPHAWYVGLVGAMFLAGVALCGYVERRCTDHDAPVIVWDEIVGYLATMTLAPPGWLWIVVGFVLFRLFDIWKPYPLRQIDRKLGGGWGTMLDDALAALYSFVALQLLAAFVMQRWGEVPLS